MDEICARFDHEWKHGDRERARELAVEFAAGHQAELSAQLAPYSLAGLVQLVEGHRDAGREEERIMVDMWLLAHYGPQQISGSIHIGPPVVVSDGPAAVAAADAIVRGEQP
jgi:hypothetical protein